MNGRYLAYILRHNPSAANVELDKSGYADVEKLIDGIRLSGRQTNLSDLERIVSTDSKGRFSFNADRTKIRANYGHSVPVEIERKEVVPPSVLYHGTAEKYLDGILTEGIKKQSRNFVHLSGDRETALGVGARHGKAVVLKIFAMDMYEDGCKFFRSESGVWLTDFVPCEYIEFDSDECKMSFEMTRLSQKRTGLSGNIFVYDMGKRLPKSRHYII